LAQADPQIVGTDARATAEQFGVITFGRNPATNRWEATLPLNFTLSPGSYQLIARSSLTDASGRRLGNDTMLPLVVANNPPDAVNDTSSTAFDMPVTISVLANDTDPDAGETLTVSAVGSFVGGTAVVNSNNTVTFTPDSGFSGEASFTYTVTDAFNGTDMATVNVTVAGPVNSPPDIVNNTASTASNTPVTISVLANDTDLDAGQTLTVTAVGAFIGGTAVINVNNTASPVRPLSATPRATETEAPTQRTSP
jgi:hypothetical protein